MEQSIQHRCPNMTLHVYNGPLAIPCADCYSVRVTSERIPYEPDVRWHEVEGTTSEAYETIPGVLLPAFYSDGDKFFHDRDHRVPVDMEKYAEAGYLRHVRVTTIKEYL